MFVELFITRIQPSTMEEYIFGSTKRLFQRDMFYKFYVLMPHAFGNSRFWNCSSSKHNFCEQSLPWFAKAPIGLQVDLPTVGLRIWDHAGVKPEVGHLHLDPTGTERASERTERERERERDTETETETETETDTWKPFVGKPFWTGRC